MTTRMPLLDFAARTDVGAIREVNEDAYLTQVPAFLVADGVGGHEAGELASQAAIAAFKPLTAQRYVSLDGVGAAYTRARAAVNRISATRERGAGTTLAGILLTPQADGFNWLIINVGDSRVYRYRAGQLQQITSDHTLRNEMLLSGVPEDDPSLPAGNVITRALGSGADVLDTWLLPLTVGDRLLVCTDGLTDTVSDADICAAFSRSTAAEVADYLLATALDLKPRDNVTFAVVHVLDAGAVSLPEHAGGGDFEDTADLTEVVAEAQQRIADSAVQCESS